MSDFTDFLDFLDGCVGNNLNEVTAIIGKSPELVYQKNEKGWTGLIVSCFHNHLSISQLLIEKGADVNATNMKGTSVLMYAKTPVMNGSASNEILSLLLASGARINHTDNFNKTILDYCMENDAKELSNWLINKGARNSKFFKSKVK